MSAKILLGTLHTEEQEFAACCESVNDQQGVNVTHFVLHNLCKKEAHNQLYGRFMDAGKDYDYFVKLDADMVLETPNVLSMLITRFDLRPRVQNFTIPVDDFFTGSRMNGMNAFRSSVTWTRRTDNLFTDQSGLSDDAVYYDEGFPAGSVSHCKDPSDYQAFHFGLHRGVKIMSSHPQRAFWHWQRYEELQQQFDVRHDRRLGLAVLGTEYALNQTFAESDIPYQAEKPREVFTSLTGDSQEELRTRIAKCKRRKAGFLESTLRFQAITKGWNKAFREDIAPRALAKVRRIFQKHGHS